MSIRFIIGRAGSGKSRRCLDEIRAHLLRSASGNPLVLLVPEQATFQAEYDLVKTPELAGMIRAQVLSFRRLAFRVMQEGGGTARIHIADTGKQMLLHKIVQKHRNEFTIFSGSADQTGFIHKLNELFKEFKRYCITSDKLDHHLERGKDALFGMSGQTELKLRDLSAVFGEFENELSRHYVDSEDYLQLLAEHISVSEYVRQADIWVDGFHGFTPQELAVIAQLMKHARSVTFALCLDKKYEAWQQPHELDLFHPTASTMIRLQQMIEQLGLTEAETVLLEPALAPRFISSPMLAHLERHFERKTIWNDAKTDASNISLQSAVHRRAEVEGAAREIIRLVRENGVRWREIAVMIRNAEGYQHILATVFEDYGIPFFFDQKRTVLHHPLVEFIRSALDIVMQNWRYDSVFRCVKTDFLLPLEPSEEDRHSMDMLENYVLAFGIHGSRWTDDRPWPYRFHTSLEGESEGPSSSEQQLLQRIHKYRVMVSEPIKTFQKSLNKADNVRQMVEALYGLLTDVQAPERLEQWSSAAQDAGNLEKAREHAQIWDSVMDVLDQMVEIMGDEMLPVRLFADIIETGMESIKLGLVPPALDQVIVGTVDRTRSNHIHYSFLLGINDGVFPSRVKEDGLLTEKEREDLTVSGLEIAPGSRRKLLDEQFLIYTALTTPMKHLWLSYPLADEEGKSLLPSEWIRHISKMFKLEPGFLLGEPSTGQSDREQLTYIANTGRSLSYLVVQLRQYLRGVRISGLWWDAYNWFCTRSEWREKLQNAVNALFYMNQETPLNRATSRLLYGQHLQASVSRMERFVACPFAQFMSHGLRLKERRVYRLEAPDIGQLFHAALSRIALNLQENGSDWGALTPEQCVELASAAIDQLSPRLQSEILFSSNRYAYIARKLKEVVSRTSIVLGEHSRRGSFAPVGLELAFGPGQPLPPLTFHLDNGSTMEIVGRIDRVDRADGKQGLMLRVIDYKSSQTSLQLAEVMHGLSLQMLTYLDVVITHAEEWLGSKAAPAGVLYFHVHNPMLQSGKPLPPKYAEEELFKKFKMKGLVHADRSTVMLMDNSLEQGHSTLIPIALKANGEFYKHSSVATENQWNVLRHYVRGVIQKIGTEITNGVVDIQPYRMGKKVPCAFCSYKPVCQFDPLLDGNEYRKLDLVQKDDVWQMMDAGGAEQ